METEISNAAAMLSKIDIKLNKKAQRENHFGPFLFNSPFAFCLSPFAFCLNRTLMTQMEQMSTNHQSVVTC
jgi:hypothetical protein